jgi:hypothetical protein
MSLWVDQVQLNSLSAEAELQCCLALLFELSDSFKLQIQELARFAELRIVVKFNPLSSE